MRRGLRECSNVYESTLEQQETLSGQAMQLIKQRARERFGMAQNISSGTKYSQRNIIRYSGESDDENICGIEEEEEMEDDHSDYYGWEDRGENKEDENKDIEDAGPESDLCNNSVRGSKFSCR